MHVLTKTFLAIKATNMTSQNIKVRLFKSNIYHPIAF